MEIAQRIHSVKEYYFAIKLREVRSLIDAGKPIINAGIGNPDFLPPDHVIPAINTALQNPKAHGYQSYIGLPELRIAMVDFYKKINFFDNLLSTFGGNYDHIKQ